MTDEFIINGPYAGQRPPPLGVADAPAFARTFSDAERRDRASRDEGYDFGHAGMSLRAYFAAHAPAEPQPWFRPVLPPEPKFQGDEPKFIGDPATFSKKDRARYDDLQRRIGEHRNAQIAWTTECGRAAAAQWPWAWGDLVLSAGGAQ